MVPKLARFYLPLHMSGMRRLRRILAIIAYGQTVLACRLKGLLAGHIILALTCARLFRFCHPAREI